MSASPTDRFAEVALQFETWISAENQTDIRQVASAAAILADLFAAAIELPTNSAADEYDSSFSPMGLEKWQAVFNDASLFPFRYYSEIFNPLPVPGEEPITGDLMDDIADIYRDVISGLRIYQAGRKPAAAWHWSFSFRNHWGEHATSAIRALYWYLRENAPE